jgi:hypothetical protein
MVTAINGILTVTAVDQEWSQKVDFSNPLSDHGHPMHLFLLRTPGLDELWHLHPEPSGDGSFAIKLPAIDAGSYRVFADIVDGSGFPWTLVGKINLRKSDLPKSSGAAPNGDDSGAVADVISEGRSAAASTVSRLPDGGAMYWVRDNSPLKAGAPLKLKFRVVNRAGQPANDLEPYMGMAAHAVIVRNDLSVFAHVHPSGSVPMASLMLVSAAKNNPPNGMEMKSHAGMAMGGMTMGDTPVGSEISLPYGFPSPGDYRLFVQVKRAGHVETGVFDTHVEQ